VKKDKAPMKDRIEFKKIVNEGGRLHVKSSCRRTNFNSALDKIDAEDKQTYVLQRLVSVRDATGKGQRLDMSTYVIT
jgi:hypothetical protein